MTYRFKRERYGLAIDLTKNTPQILNGLIFLINPKLRYILSILNVQTQWSFLCISKLFLFKFV